MNLQTHKLSLASAQSPHVYRSGITAPHIAMHTSPCSDSNGPARIQPAILLCNHAACNMPITARNVSSKVVDAAAAAAAVAASAPTWSGAGDDAADTS